MAKWFERSRDLQFIDYAKRDSILLSMGFKSYRAYLASDLWKSIREQVLNRDNRKCVCGRTAKHAHHKRYSIEVLRGEQIQWLESLCAGCHKGIEFNSHGKVPVKQANRRLQKKTARIARDLAWENNPILKRLWAEKKAILAQPRHLVSEQLKANRQAIREEVGRFSAR